eukprot:TRINITY_DN1801_c0_g1::TRINITY_DN1801_c0_g1_i1::g.25250::m.25250 TRINITY_DN1801_c0_g1::TRINITY_DN1801_c0_g1_i1::g.25250  ORF type:complete len:429 (-),score=168.67,sp/O22718/ACLA2_ARATH/57.04/5e-171,ATP-grasp_2/PF08442.5/1.3e-13 TRINITY_DN1801_c0_g1_i1:640-1926(-)
MARKKIREYDGKRLLRQHLPRFTQLPFPCKSVQVSGATDRVALVQENQWLKQEKLVVKPDVLFGKRGKHNLVLLNANIEECFKFIDERLDKELNFDGIVGVLSHFIIEPFVPHKTECYFSILSNAEDCTMSFSAQGGIEIEENWDKVKTLTIPTGEAPSVDALKTLLADMTDAAEKEKTIEFIQACFKVFEDIDFTFMEFNPFTFDKEGAPLPLDMRAELDDTALFKNTKKWGELSWPQPFGRRLFAEEQYVRSLDERTGASLKLTVLNETGRIWLMVAGGGASVIYADTVADLGYQKELGNYGEYSGAPNEEETYLYAKTVLGLATRNPADADRQGRALIIGGGIANFTDVAVTFTGIIRALREFREQMLACRMRVYVRRGGPNYEKGLAMMEKLGDELGVKIEVFGPKTNMTSVVSMAIGYLNCKN